MVFRQILTDGASEEQDEHDRGGDPKRAVQVRITLQDIQEVRAGKQRRPAPREHGGGVDVEELRVEGEGPEVALGRGAAAAARGGWGEGGGVGFAAGGAVVGECGGVEFEVFL